MPAGDSPVQEKMNRQPTMGASRSASPRPGATPSKFLISSQIIIHDIKSSLGYPFLTVKVLPGEVSRCVYMQAEPCAEARALPEFPPT
jgi:hypothetical protein